MIDDQAAAMAQALEDLITAPDWKFQSMRSKAVRVLNVYKESVQTMDGTLAGPGNSGV